MTGMLIGYARVSTNDQDLTAQKNALPPSESHSKRRSPIKASPEQIGPGQAFAKR
ncbi:hypothetical protein SAMN05216281_1359 [Cryobacterium luteum]|nr:hypothetical protein SAMN05216281_1359 [Cryobacterium luteum]